MNLSDIVDVAIFHNIKPKIMKCSIEHVPGRLCLYIQNDGIHYSFCKKNWDCFGVGNWKEKDPIMDVVKFIHSINFGKNCRYCTIVI